jgi:hypothetical protein
MKTIYADRLIDEIVFHTNFPTDIKEKIEDIIQNAPPVKPEIIMCKECMNHGKEICYFWSHFYGTINTPDYGFCYKAERRED